MLGSGAGPVANTSNPIIRSGYLATHNIEASPQFQVQRNNMLRLQGLADRAQFSGVGGLQKLRLVFGVVVQLRRRFWLFHLVVFPWCLSGPLASVRRKTLDLNTEKFHCPAMTLSKEDATFLQPATYATLDEYLAYSYRTSGIDRGTKAETQANARKIQPGEVIGQKCKSGQP
jgi:hypothetical protein